MRAGRRVREHPTALYRVGKHSAQQSLTAPRGYYIRFAFSFQGRTGKWPCAAHDDLSGGVEYITRHRFYVSGGHPGRGAIPARWGRPLDTFQ